MGDQTTKTRRGIPHQGDSRARLIAAGYSILAEKGLEATTVKEIARLAEVSPGLFHYYFESKDDLLLAVLYEAGKRLNEQVERLAFGEGLPAAIAATRDMAGKDPAWYRLRYELYALGLRNERFLPAVKEFLATIRSGIAHTVQTLTGMSEERAQAVAPIMLACFDGLALQQIAEPNLDLARAYKLLEELALL